MKATDWRALGCGALAVLLILLGLAILSLAVPMIVEVILMVLP